MHVSVTICAHLVSQRRAIRSGAGVRGRYVYCPALIDVQDVVVQSPVGSRVNFLQAAEVRSHTFGETRSHRLSHDTHNRPCMTPLIHCTTTTLYPQADLLSQTVLYNDTGLVGVSEAGDDNLGCAPMKRIGAIGLGTETFVGVRVGDSRWSYRHTRRLIRVTQGGFRTYFFCRGKVALENVRRCRGCSLVYRREIFRALHLATVPLSA